jgi:hypothetical protein
VSTKWGLDQKRPNARFGRFRLKTNCFYYDVVSQGTDLPIVSRPQGLHINQPKVEKKYMAWGDGAKRAPLTTCKAKRRKTRGIQGAQVSLRRNTQMFAPCPRRVLERTLSTSLLVVKRASGPHYPCTTDFVYTLKRPNARFGRFFYIGHSFTKPWPNVNTCFTFP